MASLSDSLSVISNAVSVEISNRVSANNVVSAQAASIVSVLSAVVSSQSVTLGGRIDTVSQQVSVLSQAMSVLSAGLGTVQMRQVTGAQVISATAFTKVSGLSLSVAANATYQIEGRVLWTTSILTGTTFGFVYPGANQVSTGTMTMESYITVLVADINMTSTTFVAGRITQAQMSTAATANFSCATGISATTMAMEIFGMVNCTSAGVIELQAKQSATGGGVQILAGSYVRAFKIS